MRHLQRNRAIVIAALTFSALVYLFAWSPVFTVRSIEIAGLPKGISESSVISKTHINIGTHLSRIDPRAAQISLRDLTWVKDVSISRNWIDGKVTATLTPRVAVGLYKGRAIDQEGTLFDLPGSAPRGLPVVSASSPDLGLEAIELFTQLPIDIRENLISISASSESQISSWQNYQGRTLKIMWGSSGQVALKVTVLQALLELPENKAIRRVDLSAPHAPIVK